MDDKDLTPQEQEQEQSLPPDDDLLDWIPPELAERARATEEKDAGTTPPAKGRKRRTDYAVQPKGTRRGLSLALLLCAMLMMIAGTIVQATGSNGLQAVLLKGRAWFALWVIGQAATLCIYLLCLLPLEKELRRLLLGTALGMNLAFGVAASVAAALNQEAAGMSPALRILSIIFAPLVALLFSTNMWLLLGVLRRRTAEKISALMGSVALGIVLLGLLASLFPSPNSGPPKTPVGVIALDLLQGAFWLGLLVTWPVLDRAVLARRTGDPTKNENQQEPEGDLNNGQPE